MATCVCRQSEHGTIGCWARTESPSRRLCPRCENDHPMVAPAPAEALTQCSTWKHGENGTSWECLEKPGHPGEHRFACDGIPAAPPVGDLSAAGCLPDCQDVGDYWDRSKVSIVHATGCPNSESESAGPERADSLADPSQDGLRNDGETSGRTVVLPGAPQDQVRPMPQLPGVSASPAAVSLPSVGDLPQGALSALAGDQMASHEDGTARWYCATCKRWSGEYDTRASCEEEFAEHKARLHPATPAAAQGALATPGEATGVLLAIHDLATARLRNNPTDPHVVHDLAEIARLAATPAAQRRPAPRGTIQMLLALHIDDPEALARAVDEMVQFVEADRRGTP